MPKAVGTRSKLSAAARRWLFLHPSENPIRVTLSIAGLSVGVYVQARLNHQPDLRPAIMRGDRTGARVSREYIPRCFIFQ